MEPYTRGWIYIVGAAMAAYLGYEQGNWADVILAALFAVSGIHHITAKHK